MVRFGLNRAKASVFVDAAAQSGEKQFDWENKITMKWGLSDVGAVLATLQGRLPQAKLFHQRKKPTAPSNSPPARIRSAPLICERFTPGRRG